MKEKKIRLTIPWGRRTETIRDLRSCGVIVSDNQRFATARDAEGERRLEALIRKGWGVRG